MLVPLAAILFAVVPAIAPPGTAGDLPVLSTLESDPADAHEYRAATGIWVERCITVSNRERCRQEQVYRRVPHLHIWSEVCQFVLVASGGGIAAFAKKALTKVGGVIGGAITQVFKRVCDTVQQIIWLST